MSASHMDLTLAPWVFACAATAVGAVTDIRSRRLPNWLTMPAFVAGILYAALALPGSHGVINALAGCAFAGLPFILLWLVGGGSAADAKMMMAVGAWIGSRDAVIAALSVALCGGALAIGLAWVRGRLGETMVNVPRAFAALPLVLLGPGKLEDRREVFAANPSTPGHDDVEPARNARRRSFKLPYGVAIFVGTFLAFVYRLAR